VKYHSHLNRILFTMAVLATVAGIYIFGRFHVAHELLFARHQNRALYKDLQTTLARLEEERTRAVVAEREADIVRQANALLRESERRRQDEIAGLEGDLAFYRRLGGASGSQAALAIHHIELQATQAPRVYRIIFTLTQNLRWASAISGRIQFGLDGIQNGVARHLVDEQLLADTAAPLTFQFKYFQQLEGLITLPAGFEPVRLTVRLRSRSLRKVVEQSVEWGALFDLPRSALPGNEATNRNASD